jgi:hypothetical protein
MYNSSTFDARLDDVAWEHSYSLADYHPGPWTGCRTDLGPDANWQPHKAFWLKSTDLQMRLIKGAGTSR